ncbi:acetyltransferase [Aquimarina longa]|uniref:acetyltransferase n=1 Tax=Aquimarina longa TaxID=1080221 RepID=UPI0007818709|nr:acetyltransferase [Aquimarina longa]
MEKIIVIGASGHAKVIIETIELVGKYQIYGLIDSYKEKGGQLFDYNILGTEEDIRNIAAKGITKGIIAIGDNWNRYLMYMRIKEIVPDFDFITVVHPSVVISAKTSIGDGTVILASVTINADAEIGDFCILNTGVNFGHDSTIKNFSSLAPGVTIGGNVLIEECTAISLGTNVIQNITIGKHTIIGAGSLVVNDIDDFKLVYGVPAKVIREVTKGERYLSGGLRDSNKDQN